MASRWALICLWLSAKCHIRLFSDEIFDAVSNPLHLAVLQARDDIVKLFIRHGMNVNCRNKFTQWTPLMTAAVSGEICTARLLFKHDADGQLSNTAGMAASQIARKCRNSELAGFIDRKTHLNLSNSLESKEKGFRWWFNRHLLSVWENPFRR